MKHLNPLSTPRAHQLILSSYLRDTLSEIQSRLSDIDINVDCYQIESYAIDQIWTVSDYAMDTRQTRQFAIYISGDYVVSNTTRDKEFFTVTNRKTQKFTILSAKLSDMVRLYPITSTHTAPC